MARQYVFRGATARKISKDGATAGKPRLRDAGEVEGIIARLPEQRVDVGATDDGEGARRRAECAPGFSERGAPWVPQEGFGG